ncbi:MAG TPA: choice-of-anchor D domain-containing protein [Streptosporangiaceae bacterium]
MMRAIALSSLARRLAQARSARTLAAVVLAAAAVSAGLLAGPSVPGSRADEVTVSANNLRDGWDSQEVTSALTRATVRGSTFGELFSADVDGQVYAQPIVADGTLIVATENDWVYGLDPVTGAIRWKVLLGTPWSVPAGQFCADLTPNVGVTGTPVYDPAVGPATPHGAVYLVSEEIPAGSDNQHPAFYLHAFDPLTGAELPNWPVEIKGAPANNPTVPFHAFDQLQRPGLLLIGGSVYAAFGSHCDFEPYAGYVVGVGGANATRPRAETMWSDEAGLTDTQAGIWQSGGGLMSDGPGRIFLATGNGISPAPGPGSRPPGQLAESVVRLAVQGDGSLVARDFFSPANAPYLDEQAVDGDLGSGAPVGLPFGTAALPHLLVQAGKLDGLYLLNRDNLGGREQGPGRTDAAVSRSGTSLPGEWGHPAAFADTPVLSKTNVAASHDYVYYLGTGDSAAGAPLRYFKVGLGGPTGLTPQLADVAQSADKFGYTSGSPVVTSNGTSLKTAVVWVVNSAGRTGTTGTLQAFPAVPPGTCSQARPCVVQPLWTSTPFSGAGKFTVPATNQGHVYVATRGVPAGSDCPSVPSGDYCGQVLAFGSPARAPLGSASPASLDFGPVPTGSTSSPLQAAITCTLSTGTVTVQQVSATGAGFSVAGPYLYAPQGGTAVPASFPLTMHPGDTLTAQGITFAPTAPGAASGSLEFDTSAANFAVVGVGLSGTGTQNGFYASAAAVDFGTAVPVGTSTQQQITVTNGEAGPLTLTTAVLPSSPFGVLGLPNGGTTIAAGQSVPLTITYQPTTTTGDTGSLSLTSADNVTTTISLTGTGAPDVEPTLTATANSVSFGSVALGHNAEQVIDVTNTGNLPALVTVTKQPRIPFGAPDPIPAGLPVNPGASLQIPVTFVPTSAGPVSDSYQLTWSDADPQGSHTITIPVTGTGVAAAGVAVPPPGGGWTFNGNARMTGTSLSLTRPVQNQSGAAVYSVPVPSAGLSVKFTAQIGGGTGAEGLTFAMLNAATEGQKSIGGSGAGLGFGGLDGVAVTLDNPSPSSVGIATSATNQPLTYLATASVPGLRTGTHVVGVSVRGGTVTVTVDGRQYLSKPVTMSSSVRLAFTGATGVKADDHVVSNVSITSNGNVIPPPGGGWSYNGTAAMTGSDTRLTPAATNDAGSVVYPLPVKAIGLRVTFDLELGGGTGGDGVTFALLNPATTKATTIGDAGSMLGLGTRAGVPGLGVVLATGGHTSPAGFAATSVAVGPEGLRFQSKAPGIGSLLSGTHLVTVNVTGSGQGPIVTIYLDDVQVLQVAEPTLSPTVRLAFTAGTGALTDVQTVRSAAISASG